MKITLQQNEIEQAVREHIAKTLDLPETAKIEFDEEDNNVVAVIDLNPVEGGEVKPTKRVYQRRAKADAQAPATGTAAGEPATAGQPAVETPAQEPAQEPAGEAKETPVAEASAQPAAEAPAQPVGGSVEEQAPEGERRSLFKGMKKPVNG